MHWEVLAATPETLVEVLDELGSRGVARAVFGTTVFAYAQKIPTDPDALPVRTGTDVPHKDFHLIVQKGRSFQRAHPEVPVLLDAGRHLVVALDPRTAAGVVGDFGIEPLGDGRIVYGTRPSPGVSARRSTPPLGPADPAALTADLTYLTDLHTRLSTGPDYREAARWAADRFRALDYEVDLPEVPVGVGSSSNVVARRFGLAADRGEVLVTAHLDSINQQDGPDAPAPGADDNASGSCGALEIARLVAGGPTDHDVTVVLFGGEEQGLFGSRAYVAGLSASDRGRIRAVINMDMIGRINTRPPTVLLEGAPISTDLIDRLADAAAAYTALAVETSLNPYASDHVPFIEAGIPAVLTIEGGDGANDAVHTARDTADRVDPAFAADIVTVVAATVADLAGANPEPAPEGGVP